MSEILEYEAHGFKLCAIDPGQKSPKYTGWQKKPMQAEYIEATGANVGLLHALSGTCVLDIDNMELARPWLTQWDISLDDLMASPDAVMISSGRSNRIKLLYRMTPPLRTLKPKGSGMEFRCATREGVSVQDVLPPSIHPDTRK